MSFSEARAVASRAIIDKDGFQPSRDDLTRALITIDDELSALRSYLAIAVHHGGLNAETCAALIADYSAKEMGE